MSGLSPSFYDFLVARGHPVTSVPTAISALTVALLEPSVHDAELCVVSFMLHEYLYNGAHEPEEYQVCYTIQPQSTRTSHVLQRTAMQLVRVLRGMPSRNNSTQTRS